MYGAGKKIIRKITSHFQLDIMLDVLLKSRVMEMLEDVLLLIEQFTFWFPSSVHLHPF